VSGTSFSTTPLYRLYSGTSNDHFYTISATERDYAVSIGYIWEGDIGHCSASPVSGQTTDLYRLVHPAGDHFYTTYASERDYAVSIGYIYEGIACYVWTSA
jgi:hypothetical protein